MIQGFFVNMGDDVISSITKFFKTKEEAENNLIKLQNKPGDGSINSSEWFVDSLSKPAKGQEGNYFICEITGAIRVGKPLRHLCITEDATVEKYTLKHTFFDIPKYWAFKGLNVKVELNKKRSRISVEPINKRAKALISLSGYIYKHTPKKRWHRLYANEDDWQEAVSWITETSDIKIEECLRNFATPKELNALDNENWYSFSGHKKIKSKEPKIYIYNE